MLRNACYCKLKKQLNELEREIKLNYSGDENLTTKVVQIQLNLASAVIYKGSVNTFTDLPTENVKVGDMYNVLDTEFNYVWNGTAWDLQAPTAEIASEDLIRNLFSNSGE